MKRCNVSFHGTAIQDNINTTSSTLSPVFGSLNSYHNTVSYSRSSGLTTMLSLPPLSQQQQTQTQQPIPMLPISTNSGSTTTTNSTMPSLSPKGPLHFYDHNNQVNTRCSVPSFDWDDASTNSGGGGGGDNNNIDIVRLLPSWYSSSSKNRPALTRSNSNSSSGSSTCRSNHHKKNSNTTTISLVYYIIQSIWIRYRNYKDHTSTQKKYQYFITFIVVPILFFYILITILDVFFLKYELVSSSMNNNHNVDWIESSPTTTDYTYHDPHEGLYKNNNNNNNDVGNDSSLDTTFSVVINTYQRPKQLHETVQHYAKTCGKKYGVEIVHVVWAEENVEPPSIDSFFHHEHHHHHHQGEDEREEQQSNHNTNRGRHRRLHSNNNNNNNNNHANRATINIRKVRNSLNSRFLPINYDNNISDNNTTTTSNPILTKSKSLSAAIFMVDDDIQVDCFSLHQAFLAWKLKPKSMVGFYPRLAIPSRHSSNSNSSSKSSGSSGQQYQDQDQDAQQRNHDQESSASLDLTYHSWPIVFWRQEFNFILTKASFLHERYLELYSNPSIHPIEIRNYVDKYFNCEDIAMSMLVANITRYENQLLWDQRKEQYYNTYLEGSISSSFFPTLHHKPPTPYQTEYQHHIESISNYKVKPAQPIYVEAKQLFDKGVFNGISTNRGHMNQRTECLMDIAKIYQEKYGSSSISSSTPFNDNNDGSEEGINNNNNNNPSSSSFVFPLQDVFDLRASSYVRHFPGYSWQMKPSNWPEWFALSNVLK